MLKFAIIIHVLLALFMILIVLLQPGSKGSSNSFLSNSGVKFASGNKKIGSSLSRLTFLVAACFIIISLVLSVLISHPGSVFDKIIN